MPATQNDIQNWIDSWNSHDIDRIVELFADDAVIHQPQNPKPLDKAGVRSFFGMMFGAYPNINFKRQGSVIEGNEAASWERVTGTMKGTFTDPATGNALEPTGKSFDILGAMHLSYNDDHELTEVRIYWDRMVFMTQLGLLGNGAS